MQPLTILDTSARDARGRVRGGGRVMTVLKENFSDSARFVSDLKQVSTDDTLLIPVWQPFQKPALTRRLCKRQILMLFDIIPLKYPEHFPIGLRGRWWLLQNIRSLSMYDMILTISEESKNDIIDYFNLASDKVKVVRLTSSKIFFSKTKTKSRAELTAQYSLPKGAYCTYVGDTNWNKNLLTLAQGVIQAGVDCVCVGKTFSIIEELRQKDADEQHEFFSTSEEINHPEQQDFKEFIKLVLHDDHFAFPGYMPDEDIKATYQHALCNIFVSYDEGFGLSYIECGAQKCPSILSDIPVFKEIAGTHAFYTNPEKPQELAKMIKSLVRKPTAYLKMQANVYKHVQTYSPAQFKESLSKLLY